MFKPVWLRNLVGFITGYGSCPNCGDRWNWKNATGIIYAIEDGENELGVSICTECCESSKKLNVARIKKSLLSNKWSPGEVETVISVLKNH